MKLFDELSVVLQGRYGPKTADLLAKFRSVAPNAEIILSTWPGSVETEIPGVKLVFSEDPGSYDITVDGEVIQKDNLNRQIVSTASGLAVATRRFTLKWRTDFDFHEGKMRQFLARYIALLMKDGKCARTVVSSVTTANPYASVGLVFHVSDWFYLSTTSALKKHLCSVPVSAEDGSANISKHELAVRGFPFGKFTAEQWMLMPLTRSFIGSDLPAYNAQQFKRIFLAFIKQYLIVVDPAELGLITSKYDYFIYPGKNKIVSYVGHQLSSVTQSDQKYLGSRNPIFSNMGELRLRLKGLVFRLWRAIKDGRDSNRSA